MAINISEKHLQLIKVVAAFPEANSLLLDDDQIKDLCVAPALMKYFTKFPITTCQQIAVCEEIVIDFPDDYTYGVVDARVTDTGLALGTGTSYWDLIAYQNTGSGLASGGAYGIKGYNPNGIRQQRDIQRQALKSYQNQYATIKTRVSDSEKKLYIYSSVQGKASITWAKFSEDFESDVKYARKMDVIKLCRANLLYHLADTSGILTDSALEVTINSDALKTRASELESEVMELWDAFQDVLFLHAV